MIVLFALPFVLLGSAIVRFAFAFTPLGNVIVLFALGFGTMGKGIVLFALGLIIKENDFIIVVDRTQTVRENTR